MPTVGISALAGTNADSLNGVSYNTANTMGAGAGVQGDDGTTETLDGGKGGIANGEDSANPAFYANAANASAAQGAQYYNQGLAALNVAAPTINNPTGAQSRASLAQNQAYYGNLDRSLSNMANGGGVNAGQAIQSQGLTNSIAAQLAAARGGHGGYQLGGALGAQGSAAAQNGALATQAAQARAAQVAGAQQGLANAYAGQGTSDLAQNATQYNQAAQQAGMQENQNQANQSQALALYNQSLGEQGNYLNAVEEYDHQAQAAQGLATSQQAINNQQLDTEIGTASKVGGALIGLV